MSKSVFSAFVPPMMAESSKATFNSPDWIFEIKLDGYRAIAVFDEAGKPHLWSRNGLPLEQKFPAVANAVSKLKLRIDNSGWRDRCGGRKRCPSFSTPSKIPKTANRPNSVLRL